MAALHVVAIYKQLGLGVHLSPYGGEQVAVALVFLCLYRALVDHNAALESSGGVVVKHIFEQLAAVAMRAKVVDR